MYDKLSFTLDNIIYNYTFKSKNDIEIILPSKTSIKTSNKNSTIVIQPTVQIEIKLFITLDSEYIPQVYIHSKNKKSNIVFANKVILKANNINLLVFTTTDGGDNWLVTPTNYSTTPSVKPNDAVTIVNNKTGPIVILDSNDIYLNGNKGPTIAKQFENIEGIIVNMKDDIVFDATKKIEKMAPELIREELANVKIISEKI